MSFLSKAAKSVSKAVSNVAKVAVAPITTIAAGSLDAVGLRSAADKVVKATEGSGKIGKFVGKASTVTGWGIDAGAVALGAAAAAPALSSAASAVGHGLAAGGTLLKSGVGNLLSRFTAPKAAAGAVDTTATDSGGNVLGTLATDATKAFNKFKTSKTGQDLITKAKGAAQQRAQTLLGSGDFVAAGAAGGETASGGSLPGWLPLVAIGGVLLLGFMDRKGK